MNKSHCCKPIRLQVLPMISIIIPAANFLQAIYDAKKMRPFFGIITPTVDHQINEFGSHFHRGEVWAEWRVVMPHDTMDNFCITKGTKQNCWIQMENSLCPVWHGISFQLRKSLEFLCNLLGIAFKDSCSVLRLCLWLLVCFCFQVVCCFFARKCSLLTRGWESFSDKGPDFYHQRIFLKIPKVSDDSTRRETTSHEIFLTEKKIYK